MKIPDRGVPTKSPKPVRPGKKTAVRSAAALGPVEDLQSYVKADWWRHLFYANYLRTGGGGRLVAREGLVSDQIYGGCICLEGQARGLLTGRESGEMEEGYLEMLEMILEAAEGRMARRS